MNAKAIIMVITVIFCINIKNTSLVKINDINYIIFKENTKILHITMNKLFAVLKLNKTFKQTPKMQLLLNMHKNFINIVEYKRKENEAYENITDKIPVHDWFNMSNIIRKISFKRILSKHYKAKNVTYIKITDENISNVILEYIKDFLNKIDRLKFEVINKFTLAQNNIHDFVTPSIKKIRHHTDDLEVWISEDKDSNENSNRRMFKSKRTKVTKYAFMVSVHVKTEFVCAGSIINKNFVITAASCLQTIYNISLKSIPDVMVRVNSDYTTYGGQLILISNIYFHPSFDSKTLKNNLAILRMDKHSRFNKLQKIKRILFDRTGSLLNQRTEVMMLGWGARDAVYTAFEFQKLSYANLDLYNLRNCKEVFSTVYVSDSNFCGGFVSKAGSTCNRDVGDPAIVADTIVGIVSFGPPTCGTPDAPTVFTKISDYAPWIDSIINLKPGDPLRSIKGKDLISEQTTTAKNLRTNTSLYKRKPELIIPEEAIVLEEILTELASPNRTMMEKIIDEGFKKEINDSLRIAPISTSATKSKKTTPFKKSNDGHVKHDFYDDSDKYDYVNELSIEYTTKKILREPTSHHVLFESNILIDLNDHNKKTSANFT